jgi:hypothetical protein
MELIPKPVVNTQILSHCIGAYASSLLNTFLALGVVNNGMLAVVNWRPHKHLFIKASDVAAIKLSQIKRGVRNGICGVASHLQPFLILNVLITPPSVSSATRCYTTISCSC